jgi:hypothetical protein
MRFSHNELASSKFEVGHTSNWVLQFERPSGSVAPDPNLFNLISGNFTPALDVNYDQQNIITKTIVVGPGIKIDVPVFLEECQSIAVTVYEEHNKILRTAIRDWATQGLKIREGKAPVLSKLIKSSLILKIQHFDKGLKSLTKRPTDAYYVMPSKELTFRGDQQFQLETLPLTFTVIGRYTDL